MPYPFSWSFLINYAAPLPQVEDDRSVSSTVTVENGGDKQVRLETADSKEQLRYVRFHEASNDYYVNNCWSEEECKDFWYDRNEYVQFKTTHQFIAREVRHAQGGTILLEDVAGSLLSSFHTNSYHKALLQTFAACCEVEDEMEDEMEEVLSRDEEEVLAKWIQAAHTRHGLERLGSRELSRDRNQRRKAIIQKVLNIQNDVILSSKASSWFFSSSDKNELICRSCQQISRPSRLFAQILAKAQCYTS